MSFWWAPILWTQNLLTEIIQKEVHSPNYVNTELFWSRSPQIFFWSTILDGCSHCKVLLVADFIGDHKISSTRYCQEDFMVSQEMNWKPGIGLSTSNCWPEQTGTAWIIFCFSSALSVWSKRTQSLVGLKGDYSEQQEGFAEAHGSWNKKLLVFAKPHRGKHL